ncbi:hybrid sensor histidine kinase/response regulator transcription factor [Gaetbulibacter saemankumensis]|uniref:hybrid sensor histidine kinase/response regulator transcription factor n=1 Tax=Gaetbulibacter saemankumensis TaxID=311208 RepID=UPI000404E7E7|nr:two-component regulator propeller domain-containing protein [Gaetbulibacter saemankumensis]
MAQSHINFTHRVPTYNDKPIIIHKTIQDHLGLIWMVTGGNILTYDGNNYNLIDNSTIFPDQKKYHIIEDLIIDNDKNIWILSSFGLIKKFNHENNQFENVDFDSNNEVIKKMISRNNILWLASDKGTIYRYANSKMDSITKLPAISPKSSRIISLESNKNNIYISTDKGNLFTYNIELKTITPIVGPFTDYPEQLILQMDNNNRLWIGTETRGLLLYDLNKEKYIQDEFLKTNSSNIHKEMFLTLFYDNDNYLWGGTDGGGLYKVNVNNGEVILFTKQYANEYSLSSNTVLDIFEDNHKNLWVSTNYGKLNILSNVNNNIIYHEGSKNKSPQRILSIYKSKDNALWFGTDGYGLTKVITDISGNTEESQYFFDTKLNKGFFIQSITEDNQGNLWVGTYKNGLWCKRKNSSKFFNIEIFNTKNQKGSDIRKVFKDHHGRIWACSNVGINIFSDDFEQLASFNNNANGLKGTITESVAKDFNNTIWIGMYNGGLFKFNENKHNLKLSSFSFYKTSKSRDTKIGIKYLVAGEPPYLWLVNDNGTPLKFNTTSYSVEDLSASQSINDKNIAAILPQNEHNIWLSSNNGIIHLNLKDSITKVYYNSDGFQDNMYLSKSAYKDASGMMYFGGVEGVNYFYPENISKQKSTAKLLLTSIEILNKPARDLIPDQVKNGAVKTKYIHLKNNQSSFSFRFSAIDNILNPKYYYAYRLKGFDKNWIHVSTETVATYTNIPPGDYTFEVRSGTKKGEWNIPPIELGVSIAYPFWNTYWAYIIYTFIIATVIYFLVLWYRMKQKLFLEKVNHKKEQEITELRMNFFTKMSHEIQTPLTLILGPIESMLKNAEDSGNLLLKERLNIINNNTKRLSKIVRELTLIRDHESGNIKLNITKNNLNKNLEDVVLAFKELARKKQIDFIINCPRNLDETWYDKDKLEHIIYNLLSNAFKFTPKNGNIQLNVIPTNNKKKIKISIIDSGSGINKQELDSIFELFYQSKMGKKYIGHGIGLALTKDLVDLHKGDIKVKSDAVEGTVFSVTIPINKAAYNEEEIIIIDDIGTVQLENTTSKSNIKPEQILEDKSKKTVLIVEDNFELQGFLKDLLETDYNIILAENGEEGFYYAKSNFPDLILSDIMMPKMDGLEMCKKLQEDPLTIHIPIVLLTAKNSTNSKLQGLKSGAIEYINKPFNTNELRLKIKNIIKTREDIISKYRQESISMPQVTLEKSQDELFLENLVSEINSRLDNPNFKMEELADSLNMGYSTLYRRCQALTGYSLVDYVRQLRLKKAAILISKYGYNISEASFMCGFNDPKYFSKCFKKQFKKTPNNFKKEAMETDVNVHLEKYNIN